jgi:hypothetical protein
VRRSPLQRSIPQTSHPHLRDTDLPNDPQIPGLRVTLASGGTDATAQIDPLSRMSTHRTSFEIPASAPFIQPHFSPPGPLENLDFLATTSTARGTDADFSLPEWSEHDLVTDWPTSSTSDAVFRTPGIMTDLPPHLQASNSNPPATRPPLILLEPPARQPEASRSAGLSTSSRQLPSGSAEWQMEDVAPWNTISFFITIYMTYSHSLFPLVHRPSFSQSLALRRDKTDKEFRAFVLGIGRLPSHLIHQASATLLIM